MLEIKKVYVLKKDYRLEDDDITLKKGERIVIVGYLGKRILCVKGIFEIQFMHEDSLEAVLEECPDALPMNSFVKIVKFSNINGNRWLNDLTMNGTLGKHGIVRSVGVTEGRPEPWYKVQVGHSYYYYDRASLEPTELEDGEGLCEDCGTVITEEDGNYTGDSRLVCDDCYYNYDTCSCCGGILRDMTPVDGEPVCDNCLNTHYLTCPHCESFFHTDNGFYDCETGHVYCSEDCLEIGSGGDYLHEYMYKPEPKFHLVNDEPTPIGYYGVEVELEYDGSGNRLDAVEEITSQSGGFVYCKKDSSLDYGVEIVSHPASYAFHMTDIWERIIDTGRDYGMENRRTCGLHVHASRTLFGNTGMERQLTIAKVVYVFERLWDDIVTFSRRKDRRSIYEYAHKSDTGIKGTDDSQTVRDKLRTNGPTSRYSAVNLCNSQTVEFRIFASTTDVDELKGTIGFVHVLIQYCKAHTVKQCQMLTWKRLVDYSAKRSPEFYALAKKTNK